MRKYLSATLGLIAVLSLPCLALAQKPYHGHGSPHSMGRMDGAGCCSECGSGMGMGNMDQMVDMCLAHAGTMELTDEQKAKLTPIRREMQRKRIQFKSELKLAEMDLAETMEEKNFDLDKASAAVKKIGDIKTRHHLEMLKQMREVRGILSDAQFSGAMAPGGDTGDEEDEGHGEE